MNGMKLVTPTRFQEPVEEVLQKSDTRRIQELFTDPMSQRISKLKHRNGQPDADNPYQTTASKADGHKDTKDTGSTASATILSHQKLSGIIEQRQMADAYDDSKASYYARNPFNYKSISPITAS